MVSTQQPGENVTHYQYDQTGQLVTSHNPAAFFGPNTATHHYDPQGNIINNANDHESSPSDDSSIDLSASLG